MKDKKIYVMAALGCNFTLNIWNSICIISQSISKYWKLTRTNPCRRVAAATFEIHVFSAARTASIFSLTSHFPGSRNFSMPASCRTRTPCSPGIPRTISSGYIKTNSFEVYLIQLWYLVDWVKSIPERIATSTHLRRRYKTFHNFPAQIVLYNLGSSLRR